jgi:4-azaleucine resistance transporter AzlC
VLPLTSPVFFGYIAIGIPFGLMLVAKGYSFWFSPLMSIVMYAGAGQYMAVGLFASGAPLSVIISAMLLINIKHVVYGISLIEPFKHTGRWKPYLIFALTDETYALMTTLSVPPGMSAGAFYGRIALLDHLYWIAGSVIGAAAGAMLNVSLEGIDFALTSLFAVLLLEQILKTRRALPVVIGVICTVAAIVFLPASYAAHTLLVAMAASLTLLSLCAAQRKGHPLC